MEEDEEEGDVESILRVRCSGSFSVGEELLLFVVGVEVGVGVVGVEGVFVEGVVVEGGEEERVLVLSELVFRLRCFFRGGSEECGIAVSIRMLLLL